MNKTNAMRMLDNADIQYKALEYECDESDLSGVTVAAKIGLPCEMVFKTLTARGDKTGLCVFCIPADKELDLKKAARAAHDKKVELIHVKELLPLTGYIRGGCSPIGMKKPFPTFMDETAMLYDEIAVSAGVRGCQIILSPESLSDYCSILLSDLISLL